MLCLLGFRFRFRLRLGGFTTLRRWQSAKVGGSGGKAISCDTLGDTQT